MKKILIKSRLSIRYIRWILPILFVLLFIFGLITYFTERKNILSSHEALYQTLTGQVATTLTTWTEDQIRVALTVAQAPVVIEACANPRDAGAVQAARAYVRSVHDRYPHYENIPLAVRLNSGEEIQAEAGGQLREVRNGQFFIDTVNGQSIGRSGADVSHIRSVFEGKPWCISEVHPSISGGTPVFGISAPVRKDGEVVGAAVIVPRMSYFTELFVNNVRTGETGYLFFFDDRGLMIFHPDKHNILNEDFVTRVRPLLSKTLKGERSFEMTFDGVRKKYVIRQVDFPAGATEHRWYIAATQNMAEITRNARLFLNLLAAAGVFFFAGISLALIVITHFVFVSPITHASAIARRMADFDLTADTGDYSGKDAIGDLLRALTQMVANLREVLSLVSDAARDMNLSVNRISGSVENQAVAASQQSASVSEVTSTLSELSASFAEIADHSDSVAELAENALKATESGAESVDIVRDKMEEISRDNRENLQKVVDLGKKSKEISKIMAVINKISDQTRLIAFNAALEAAAAGEAGKRFGVVAAEIRRLADSVTESTDETEARINEIQGAISHMIVAAEKGTKGIEEGLDYASRTSARLSEIVRSTQSTADAARQISLATQQQRTAGKQVVTALREIDEAGRQTADSIRQISDTTKDLTVLSDKLKDLIDRFKFGS